MFWNITRCTECHLLELKLRSCLHRIYFSENSKVNTFCQDLTTPRMSPGTKKLMSHFSNRMSHGTSCLRSEMGHWKSVCLGFKTLTPNTKVITLHVSFRSKILSVPKDGSTWGRCVVWSLVRGCQRTFFKIFKIFSDQTVHKRVGGSNKEKRKVHTYTPCLVMSKTCWNVL
jgi:hypothetical protein